MGAGAAKVRKHEAGKNGDATNGKHTEVQQPPKPVKAYYDMVAGKFYHEHNGVFLNLKEEGFGRILRSQGYTREAKRSNTLSFLEHELMRIQLENHVYFAGELAGYQAGEHVICGKRCLVTKSPAIPRAEKRPFPVIKKFLAELLDEEARKHFAGWLLTAYRSLEAGPPWVPGQALVLCGPAGCGKNLLQAIITHILGGRAGKPYEYMSGKTGHNKDLLSAEHQMIQDEVEHPDYKARRFFGARIKDFTVNELQRYHPKGIDAFNLTPFWRLSISLNEEMENLKILPPLEMGINDKIMLFRCRPTNLPVHADDPTSRGAFWAKLEEEIPGLLYDLKRWRMPPALKHNRFGVRAYLDDSLVNEIDSLSPEFKLWSMLNAAGVMPRAGSMRVMPASEIEDELRTYNGRECDRLFHFNNACGAFMSKLAQKYPERIRRVRGEENARVWELISPATNGNGQGH